MAVFSMSPLKSPRPDGMPLLFFQKFWHIVSSDVTRSVLSILNDGRLLHKMNFTHIVLIPKRNNPKTDYHFRQVSTERRELEGIAISRGAPWISHLLFTDNIIIFRRATDEAMQTLTRVLDTYAAASAQEINLEKSSIMINCNINAEQQRRLATIIRLQVVMKHDKYLGLPAVAGKSWSELFQSVKDCLWARIDGGTQSCYHRQEGRY
ncbi:UNVERIFIED_CONTAM: hypothetical protein Sradi_4121300 [Sesamum radiatum]|uniref:Reverse transcriptase n=1 Tax=Sesamum radiatum TaxID=300843 RepID=A0AAW2P4P5_SESRA